MILLDPLREYKKAPYGKRWWCHMHSDTSLTELHDFAIVIGMRLAWFQPSPYAHYDLPIARRVLALKHGAVAVGAKEALTRNFDYRAKHA